MNSTPLLSHVLHSNQFDRTTLDYICRLTDAIRQFDKSKDGLMYLQSLLAHKRAMLYFTQPSTRTYLSFESACHIVGVKPSEIRDSATSSEMKGESIEDSLRTFSSYVDLIIMRTPVPGLCDRIAEYLDSTSRPVPIINAGSGPDEHPTQALLDIYTLTRGFKNRDGIDGKSVVLVGDLKRGRTARSLCKLLTNYKNMKLTLVAPDQFKITDDLRQELNACTNIEFRETDDLEASLPGADAIYMTRVQDEYDLSSGESKAVDYSKFHLTYDHLDRIEDHAVIMHPLPRRAELDRRIDNDKRARYWRQERNGMWVRVALITMLFNANHKILLPAL